MIFINDILKIFFLKDYFFDIKNIKKIRLSLFYYIIISILEFLSIGILVIIVLNFLDLENNFLIKFDLIDKYNQLTILIFFLIIIFFKYLFQILLYYYERKIYRDIQNNFLSTLLEGYFFSTNKLYTNYSHSNVINNLIVEVRSIFSGFFRPSSDLFSEGIITFFLIIFLVYLTGPVLFFGVFITFLLFLIFLKSLSRLANKWGKKRLEANDKLISFITGLLNSFSLVKMYQKENFFLDKVKSYYFIVTNAEFLEDLGQKLFRVFLEGFVFLIFIIFLFSLTWNGNGSKAMSELVSIFIPFLRLIPAFLKLNSSLNKMLYTYPSVLELKKNLNSFKKFKSTKISTTQKANFNKEINVKDLFYRYSEDQIIFRDFNLDIKKNEKYLFIGASGTGKTTLAEILIGERPVEKGKFKIDDVNYDPNQDYEWRNLFSYVPQDIFLLNGTILENIAFGEEKNLVDLKRIKKTLDNMNLLNISPELIVKNYGKNLSGGQKQRIGICRALYYERDIIILDEPTSALNEKDSIKIIQDIIKLNKTVIVISHDKNIMSFFKNIINI